MYVKSLVIDGFKSYANRVEINDFDRKFNAITGLNGTGKSNILDSICFVLGITNLSNMRASNLQDLVFKSGNAGITKCFVSVTFDNTDPAQCPIGYENTKEITVTRMILPGGKNKFILNGVSVQNRKIADMFGSVQLNVNKPHFLIMQGRITKVLAMTPPEVLSLVEEAAGTRMYEDKKQAAQNTIEKKDAKLNELNVIIREDIAPKLQKLQDERAQFQEYQKVVRELDNLQKLNMAWRYVKAEENIKTSEDEISTVEAEIRSDKDAIKHNEQQALALERQAEEINRRLDEECGSVLKTLETELAEAEKLEASAASERKEAAEGVSHAEKKLRLLNKTHEDDCRVLADKQTKYNKATASFGELRAAAEGAEAALADAQSTFVAVSAGAGGSSGATLQDQLMEAKKQASMASTAIAQNGMEQRHCDQRLRQLRDELQHDNDADRDAQRRLEARADTLQSELSSMEGADGGRSVEELENTVKTLAQDTRGARDRLDAISAQLQACHFHYIDPEPNFDRNRVLGTVCRLMTVVDSATCAALEAVAGGRLYNVVVDTDATSRLVLEGGQLRARATLIPLNRIQPHVMEPRRLARAQQVGGGADYVRLALNLISFEKRVRPAMEWIFGQTLVCRDLDTAKRVTYHPDVKRRCVTLDGDVFDPSGSISGGARLENRATLERLAELRRLEAGLEADEVGLRAARQALAAAQARHEARRRYSAVCHELEVVRARSDTSANAALRAEAEALEARAGQLRDDIAADKARVRDAAAAVKLLQAQLADLHGHREREFKKAEEALAKAKTEAEKRTSLWRSKEQEYETLRLEVLDLETSVAATLAQLDELKQALVTARNFLEKASTLLAEKEAKSAEVRSRIATQRAALSAHDSSAAKLHRRVSQIQKRNDELALLIMQKDYSLQDLRKEHAELQTQREALCRDNAWLESERQYFGLAGGLYDFEQRGAAASGQRLAQLRERKDRLARGLNARAHTLLGKEEEQYQEVMSKKKIVEADRSKLVNVIAQLDEKKRRKLLVACEQVNKDFASIFASLLPGAQAELVPPPRQTLLDGLEIRVGFSGVWKSLSELSGGQRSLVALSLVLAMLLFRPAPLYILDEIDAALDLSHTQNIGEMLSRHFGQSQFIIVSLKDGMFNNANVLYRTSYTNGVSSVARVTGRR